MCKRWKDFFSGRWLHPGFFGDSPHLVSNSGPIDSFPNFWRGRLCDRLAFCGDGNTLVAVGEAKFRIWRAPSWTEIEAAEKDSRQSDRQ